MLEYKADWYGSEVRKVDRFFPSSKRCTPCGFTWDKLPLNIRKWTCPECGTRHDRDRTAACNILVEGLSKEEFDFYYPEFQGKLRLWRSGKTSSAVSAVGQGSLKQEATNCST